MSEDKTFHIMAGLPRSGSTMLSAILNQNPRFHSGPSSPVYNLILSIDEYVPKDELYQAYPKPKFLSDTIRSVIKNYYGDVSSPVIFDKNRLWPQNIVLFEKYIQTKPKIICPVRDISEILASFICLIRRNQNLIQNKLNLIDEQLVKVGLEINDFNRCKFIAGEGILGLSYDAIKTLLDNGYRDNVYFIEYKDLVTNTKQTIKDLYDFLEEDYYIHDFNNLENKHRENDTEIYRLPDMHYVRPEIKSIALPPEEVLSKKVLEDIKGSEFWRSLLNQQDENKLFLGNPV